MPKYIALLRGINVSGQKLIKMENLRAIFTDLGYKNVQTYIQSGNVIFETVKQDTLKLALKIEKGLSTALGYDIPVIVRTAEQIADIVKTDMFKKLKAAEDTKIYVAFLAQKPDKEQIKLVESFNNPVDIFHVHNTEIYLIIDERKGKSLFTNVFVEKKLKMAATTRNWNTVCKLSAH